MSGELVEVVTVLHGVRIARALRLAGEAVEENPKNANRQSTLGKVLYRQGRIGEARRCCEEAVERTQALAQQRNPLNRLLQDEAAELLGLR